MAINLQSKQLIINHNQFRLTSVLTTVWMHACQHTFDVSFGSLAIFRTVSKVKGKGCFGLKFCTFKILFEKEIYISYMS